MNPAALKANLRDVPKGGTIIVNTDSFNDRTLQKAGYGANPLEDGSLGDYHLHEVALTSMTVGALKGIEGVTPREAERSKNFFALGLMSWLYHRPTDGTIDFISRKFAKRPEIVEANTRAFQAGWNYGETSEDFAVSYEVAPAPLAPGTYRQITGNTALSYGLIAASKLSGLPLFLGAYPITPASSILEELARPEGVRRRHLPGGGRDRRGRRRGRRAFGGALGVTASAGPGVVLKAETVGLAIALELPLVILDIQRAGPSTGMPTKPEQADLLMVLFGRNGESPVPVVAASTPAQCFDAAIEAARIALKYRTPVFLLSDAYLANGSEPWLIPDVADAARHLDELRDEANEGEFKPYLRDPETLARPWAIPGTPGLEHRIGGLEKADVTGAISYDPDNHDLMVRLRAQKVAGIAADIPELAVDDPDDDARAARARVGLDVRSDRRRRTARAQARDQGRARPSPLPEPLPAQHGRRPARGTRRCSCPEMNLGQLLKLLRAEFLVDAIGYNSVRGRPFRARSSRRRSRRWWSDDRRQRQPRQLTAKDFKSDQEVRWCPGCGDYAILAGVQSFMPELGRPAREHRVRVGHRLRGPLPVLRARRTGCTRSTGARRRSRPASRRPGRPLGLGRDRRRRRAVDRRQPPDPRAAPQRRHHDPPLQQPDLRPDEGAVLADVGAREGHEVDAVRLGRLAVQPTLPGDRRRGDVRRARDRHRQRGLTEVLRAAAAHRGAAFVEIFQNCNIYNDGAFDVVRDDKSNRIYLEHGKQMRCGEEGVPMRRGRDARGRRGDGRRRCSGTTRCRDDRASRSRSRG